jgi:hypothetical protein
MWHRGGVEEGWLERRFFRNSRLKRGLRISDPTAKVLQNLIPKSVPYPRRRLLTDVVPELSWRNLDFSHHRIQVPEER